MSEVNSSRGEQQDAGHVRERIIRAAIRLLEQDGRDEVTTRAVAAEAGVQAPAIYRCFGDKQGLMHAVAEFGFGEYLTRKLVGDPGESPIDAFRAGWNVHVGFGLSNPALFSIMYGDPAAIGTSPAAARGYEMLQDRMQALAAAGLLRIPVRRAAEMVAAAGCGTVFTLLAKPEQNAGLSEAMREALLESIVVRSSADPAFSPAVAAISLMATLPQVNSLSNGERALLTELLERLGSSAMPERTRSGHAARTPWRPA